MTTSSDLAGVSRHMRDLGLAALAHANWHAGFISFENPYWSELSVLQAAHAAEILLKAKIAEAHPLLIFENIPRQKGASSEELNFQDLLENGRTYRFSDLPDRLWATSGLKLSGEKQYREFGRLRNQIQHFTHPDDNDLSRRVLEFVFEVVDPFLNSAWDLYAVDYCEDYSGYGDFVTGLIERRIPFSVSPGLADEWASLEIKWPPDSDAFRANIEERVAIKRSATRIQT